MFLTLLTVLLGALLLYAVWPVREGNIDDYTDEESNSTKGLVTKNEANIADLEAKMNALLELDSQVQTIQQTCDANTTNIASLTENI